MHREERSDQDPYIHYGTIASGNQIVKDARKRDLMRAAANGHRAVIDLLLATERRCGGLPAGGTRQWLSCCPQNCKVEASLKNNEGQTPLWWVARNGHGAMVELLLATGKVHADSKDDESQTLLQRAATNRH